MQLWFHFLCFFSTWLCKRYKVNYPCKLSLRTVLHVGHSDLEFHQKSAYELWEFRILLVAEYLSLNYFLLATWSRVRGDFFIATSTQVKPGGSQLQLGAATALSFIVCPAPSPSPSTSGILTSSCHPLLSTHRAACRRKQWEEEKQWNAGSSCFHSIHSLPTTVCFHVKPAKHTGPHRLTPVTCA